MMASSVSSLSLLTRRLANVGLSSSSSSVSNARLVAPLFQQSHSYSVGPFVQTGKLLPTTSSTTTTLQSPLPQYMTIRAFGANSKKNQKIAKEQQRRKGVRAKEAAAAAAAAGEGTQKNEQLESWVKFQQSIAVDGFETGQTMLVSDAADATGTGGRAKGSRTTRGGKRFRKRREKKAEESRWMAQEKLVVGGGEYTFQRYSDEETERLLKEAYAGIPARTGPRRSRHKQRESNRWHRVRQARKIAKRNYGIRQHERRMLTRSAVVKAVKQVKHDAPMIREKEAAYQQLVLEKWMETVMRAKSNHPKE